MERSSVRAPAGLVGTPGPSARLHDGSDVDNSSLSRMSFRAMAVYRHLTGDKEDHVGVGVGSGILRLTVARPGGARRGQANGHAFLPYRFVTALPTGLVGSVPARGDAPAPARAENGRRCGSSSKSRCQASCRARRDHDDSRISDAAHRRHPSRMVDPYALCKGYCAAAGPSRLLLRYAALEPYLGARGSLSVYRLKESTRIGVTARHAA
jgi:hypothetical protein